MIRELLHFLMMVLASICGILFGAHLAQSWENVKRKAKNRKR